MSSNKNNDKKTRFEALGELSKSVELEPIKPGRDGSESVLGPFSSHLMGKTKRRLKQAAARENRKLYETLEQAINEYLERYHPDIK